MICCGTNFPSLACSSEEFLPNHWVTILNVIILVIVIYLARRFLFKPKTIQQIPTSDSTIEILKQRYARGEITHDDYERMKKIFMI